ncbi:hypothetical protein G6355_18880 [Vibrio cholerae]|uniref:hypothetical protein n=1 Tax=Vibrio cholerae TaxID=666 RepID=UPI001159D214|nr:hypothetical protein [Vibrio cholerae]EHS4950290.1 hypothetical protein [Vibrio cholerae]EKF9501371.1 hypothetical protein [Vibrio cholerae]ELL3753325.1 hypothetical protein [Vibrio cholerae]ELN6894514.1 hypothetical protein [Vibrio cholerae]MCX9501271.1 hypothetical protein [Vibrio cholerae]
MKQFSKLTLFIFLFIPGALLLSLFPKSAIWLYSYILVMYSITKSKKNYLNKGGAIIYFGAAFAVIGKSMLLSETFGELSPQESNELLETFCQVMLMASSGLGGGLIAHHIISSDTKK